jgi:hypothetical protein
LTVPEPRGFEGLLGLAEARLGPFELAVEGVGVGGEGFDELAAGFLERLQRLAKLTVPFAVHPPVLRQSFGK